ncbi:MAG TPA: alpha/beta hydrolase [Mycobacteriales bacterium]|nr:alpha/beta hydrolase [Mycobacteriales bacterium]
MDAVVRAVDVDIAVREFGGAGRNVLLLHGGGNTLVDMAPLAAHLVDHYRVLGLDLRNHGLSGDGQWSWDAVLADLRAVVETLGLANPVLVGHSLGGMVAAMYAQRYPDVTAAVNLDGHGPGTPDQYDLDASEVTRLLEQLEALTDESIRALAQPRTREELSAARDGWVAAALALGLAPDLAAEAFDRKLVARGDETFISRPVPERLAELRAAVDALDVVELYRQGDVPQLVYVATRDQPGIALPTEIHTLIAARRSWLIRELRTIAAADPRVHVLEIDATHGLIYEQPKLIAEQVRRFVDGVVGDVVGSANTPAGRG